MFCLSDFCFCGSDSKERKVGVLNSALQQINFVLEAGIVVIKYEVP